MNINQIKSFQTLRRFIKIYYCTINSTPFYKNVKNPVNYYDKYKNL